MSNLTSGFASSIYKAGKGKIKNSLNPTYSRLESEIQIGLKSSHRTYV